MSISRRIGGSGRSENRPLYLTSFVHRSHQLVKLGYDRLNPTAYTRSEEEDITGELTRAMQDALQSPGAPIWAKHFWASEEVRLNEPDRRGKRRRRIDIEVMQHLAGPRPRFRFEAKRLRDAATRRDYLGKDGLGCFLDGHYAPEADVAGMLGYVQADSVSAHSASLAAALLFKRKDYRLRTGGEWSQESFVTGLETFRSIHSRGASLPPIIVLHSLLAFCEQAER